MVSQHGNLELLVFWPRPSSGILSNWRPRRLGNWIELTTFTGPSNQNSVTSCEIHGIRTGFYRNFFGFLPLISPMPIYLRSAIALITQHSIISSVFKPGASSPIRRLARCRVRLMSTRYVFLYVCINAKMPVHNTTAPTHRWYIRLEARIEGFYCHYSAAAHFFTDNMEAKGKNGK
jgi:hypothetical protein